MYNERNVSRIKRVNFDGNNSLIVLPSRLEDYTNIELSFRTSQDNAILLQCEEGSDHFHISINNSWLYASLVVDDQTHTSRCHNLKITNTNWYKLVVEPILGSDASNQVLVTLYTPPDNPIPSDRCDLDIHRISTFCSTPVVIGGTAGGVSSLMGCLESMLNMQQVNFDIVLSDTIHTGDCEPCDISPCLNGGRVAMLMTIALTAAVLMHTLVISVVSVISIDFINNYYKRYTYARLAILVTGTLWNCRVILKDISIYNL